MKKMLSMMLIMASFVCLSSCSKDGDEEEKISIVSYKQLNVGDTFELGYEGDWASSNPFVATVDEKGTVYAQRTGTADIYSKERNLYCHIVVYASYTLYNDLVTEWGMSKEHLIEICGAYYATTDNVVGYKTDNEITPLIMYTFKYGFLSAASILVKTTYTDELVEHLKQRYKLLTVDTENYNLYCIDADDTSDAETVVVANLYNSKYWMVTYMPNTTTKSLESGNENMCAIMENLDVNLNNL